MKTSKMTLWLLMLVAGFALTLTGCSGGSGSSVTPKQAGYQLDITGTVEIPKSSAKTVGLVAATNTVSVYDASTGLQLGSSVPIVDGKFSGLTYTLTSTKTTVVYVADVTGGKLRYILPLDLSNPPQGQLTNNPVSITINQDSTNTAAAVEAEAGISGFIGDGTAKTTLDFTTMSALVVKYNGYVLAYNTNGINLSGTVAGSTTSNSSLLPARDASTFTYSDLNNILFDAKIISAFVPGKNPVVNFQVTDKTTGKGISGLKTFGLHIAKLVPESNGSSSYWVNYLDRGISLPAPLAFATSAGKQVTGTIGKPVADPAKTLVASTAVGINFAVNPVGSVLIPGYTVIDHGDGSYTARFYSDVTSNTTAGYAFDAAATHRVGVTVTTVATPGVTATFPIDPATGSANASIAANNRVAVVYDFIPATGAMLTDATGKQMFARNLVPTSACNGCHTNIASIMGHTARPNVLLCDICHTPANTTGEADMGPFIHRIHMGKNLPIAVVAENVANPTKLIPRTAVLVPYTNFAFPAGNDLRNCTVCHQGAEAAAWKTKPNKKNCGSCHNAVDFVAHQGSGGDDSLCAGCHSATVITTQHATDYATPNNPQTPASLVNFKYDVKSVTVDAATNVTTINFGILSDGGTGAAMAPIAVDATTGLLSGFTGGPSFLFAYNKSTANQEFTTSADYNNLGSKAAQPKTVSIVNLANGTLGTLGAPGADGYYTATVTAAASGFTNGAKMRTVALQGYFTQVSPASGRHTLSVVKTATGDTARRVVIDSGKCGACHEVFEGHGGNRNISKNTVGEAVCTLCHVPNLSTSGKGIDKKYVTSTDAAYLASVFGDTATAAILTTWGTKIPEFNVADPTKYPEETNNLKDMIHGIHAGKARTVSPLRFVRDRASSGSIVFFDASTFTFPAVLKNCEACHTSTSYKTVPVDAQVTTDVTVPLNADGTVVTTFDTTNNVATVSKGRTLLPNAADTVTTPFTAACVSCHDLATSKAHMTQNGGQIKVPRVSAVPADEACVTCHGTTGTASIYTSHRF